MFFISMMFVIETLKDILYIYMNDLFLYGLIYDFIMNHIIIYFIWFYMVRVVKLFMKYCCLFNMQASKKL